MKEIIQIKGQHFQIKLQIPQPKAVSDINNFPKSMKTVDLKTEFMDPNNFRQDKIKRRVQNFKNLGKQLQLQQLMTT